ncbi:MAG: phosphoserine phosphatase SerB [Gammaproteobacteria bacterium]|jgi:phosphoserine phosphatase
MTELVLISVSGTDKPGITSRMASLLAHYDVDVLDVGQSVIHDHLSLGILANLPDTTDSIREAIAEAAHALDVEVMLTPVSRESYANWVGLQGASRFILTLLARRIRASHIAEVSQVIAANGLNIDNITRLSGRVPLEQPDVADKACVEFSLRGTPTDSFREQLLAMCADLDIDVAVQEDGIYRRTRRLIAFDMDSTLIKTEVIDELAMLAGVGDEVSAITASAMAGDIDFATSLAQRVSLLEGLPVSALTEVAERLPLMEGAVHLFEVLNTLGYKTAILSGGFTYFGEVLQRKLGIDYVFANELEIREGCLTGRVLPPVVDAARKAELLRSIADREGISLKQTIAVGDGANDLAMLDAAGMGIAFHAKPLVRESAGHAISTLGLDSILYLMGIRDRDGL